MFFFSQMSALAFLNRSLKLICHLKQRNVQWKAHFSIFQVILFQTLEGRRCISLKSSRYDNAIHSLYSFLNTYGITSCFYVLK